MVDVHCHILPGLDDGPDAIDNLSRWPNQRSATGSHMLSPRPHAAMNTLSIIPVSQHLASICKAKLGDRLILATGCDFHLNPENIDALRIDPSRFCITSTITARRSSTKSPSPQPWTTLFTLCGSRACDP